MIPSLQLNLILIEPLSIGNVLEILNASLTVESFSVVNLNENTEYILVRKKKSE